MYKSNYIEAQKDLSITVLKENKLTNPLVTSVEQACKLLGFKCIKCHVTFTRDTITIDNENNCVCCAKCNTTYNLEELRKQGLRI